DLHDVAALASLVEGADTVVHIAGAISAASTDEFMKANRDGTANVATAAVNAGVGRFIHVSSLSAREPGLSSYGASKRAGEDALREVASGKMKWVIVRPPAVYGPGDKATLPLLKALLQRYAILPGRADARFSMIYADDLAAAIVALIGNDKLDGTVVELDDGAKEGHSWAELASTASKLVGRPVKPVFLPQFALNCLAGIVTAAARATGATPMLSAGKVRELYHRDWRCKERRLQDGGIWQPEVNFAEGFKKTLGWYKEHGWL
ncbi:MAG: NAD-dependent epimerase/dehydratase family protein, partial [Hyphomicrobiales bacterium]